jgi:hypothetical protein
MPISRAFLRAQVVLADSRSALEFRGSAGILQVGKLGDLLEEVVVRERERWVVEEELA